MFICLCAVYGICDVGHDIRWHAVSSGNAHNTSLCGTGSSARYWYIIMHFHVCIACVGGRVGQGLEETGEGI